MKILWDPTTFVGHIIQQNNIYVPKLWYLDSPLVKDVSFNFMQFLSANFYQANYVRYFHLQLTHIQNIYNSCFFCWWNFNLFSEWNQKLFFLIMNWWIQYNTIHTFSLQICTSQKLNETYLHSFHSVRYFIHT